MPTGARQSKRTSKKTAKKRGSGKSARDRSRVVSPAGPDPDWYKDAIIYELHVRAFADSNGDGIGDFRGLTERLDYLRDLGVTAIWMLPFYLSPLRDDGYDIADYTKVNPSYGNRRDVRRFIDEAHKRGLRVITELVINHTSDQHPWFQRARRAPKGSPLRDFYVWSDDPEKYSEARIIFQDFENSNWTYDPEAGQYYWHRFYHHQPDLNFENPALMEALLDVMDQWFEAGVDGMRLDAVPYLFEREGTNCENLPETHDVLKKLRSHVDTKWPHRMLLAEANQWPEDSIEYFGDGDECHMAFHFPLMPRLFVSLRMEDRFPIIDILQQTPDLPSGCQWAIFLRNHDELTLEMVTDEERDYMYRSYASDKQMRINLGIRRRLAPLLSNNRRKIELLNGLLFSLPGTPVLYYGDEIGMGDNVYLGDRDSVRTPMQWSGDRNAGFSKANPQKLFLPVIIDPEYHYETVNVESQLANTSSLLWWMKRLIALRKQHPVFGRGELEFLHPENPKVLAYIRRHEDEHVLVVANLSRFAQPVELDLSVYEGQTPVEMFGHTPFPRISDEPYFLALGPHSFHWFHLKSPESMRVEPQEEAPTIDTRADLDGWLTSAAASRWIEKQLPRILPNRRWYGSKSKSIRNLSVEDVVEMPIDADEDDRVRAAVFMIRVEFAESDDEVYAVPLATATPTYAALLLGEQSPMVYANVRSGERSRVLYDATADETLWKSFISLINGKKTIKGKRGQMHGYRPRRRTRRISVADLDVRLSRAEQSNSSALFSDQFIMKLFRRVEEGVNPDLEIGEHLTTHTRFPNTPALSGAIEYSPRGGSGETMTLTMLQRFVPNEGDAWSYTLDSFGRFIDRVLSLPQDANEPPKDDHASVVDAARGFDREGEFSDLFDGYLDNIHLLGVRTAEMHVALASDGSSPAFKPEEFTKLYQRSLYQSMRNAVQRSLQTLRTATRRLEGSTQDEAKSLNERRDEVLGRLKLVADHRMHSVRIRCHGDYHLGQVLWTGRDFCIIDFEGEPMRALGERRLKRSALMDVAGMLRSLQYASAAGLHELAQRGVVTTAGDEHERLRRWSDFWRRRAEAAYLAGYLGTIHAPIIPDDDVALRVLLDAWLLQKASYELAYELNNRPDWVNIPLRGITALLDAPPSV